MEQIRKRFTGEQVRALLKGYHQRALDRPAIEEILRISKSTFFVVCGMELNWIGPITHKWKQHQP